MTENLLDPWQFRLTEARGQMGPGQAVGPFRLEAGPGLGVYPVSDSAGQPVGLLLGFVIDLVGKTMLAGPHRLGFALGQDPDLFAERVLGCFGGRFLWIFCAQGSAQGSGAASGQGSAQGSGQGSGGGVQRIYPDASAQVPCVFDAGARSAGSTSHALLDEAAYAARFDHALYDGLGLVGQGWFPAGLTAHHGIERLLPNHYLDLTRWQVVRHWPKAEIVATPDPEASIDAIVQLVRDQLQALRSGPRSMVMALTAGRETRMLLACARPWVTDIEFVTITGADRHATDSVMAQRIAQGQGLHHRAIPRVLATADQRARFIRRGGHCVGDSNALYHPSVWPLAANHIFVGGLGGEVGRAFLWKKTDTPDTPLTGAGLMNRFGLPEQAGIAARLDTWLHGLSGQNSLRKLDLAYLEQRMAPWYAAQFCCDPTLPRLAPLITRRGIELILGLPDDWKRAEKFGPALLSRIWPELLDYPFNTLGPWRDRLIKLQRVAQNPAMILKKLRKLRG